MVAIQIQESEAMDRLTILLIKIEKGRDFPDIQKKLIDEANELQKTIVAAITEGVASLVFRTPEYIDLFLVNKKLFEAVDLAKTDAIKASEVDSLVSTRYLTKKKLQEKFFNSQYKEIKLGYTKITN